MESGWINPKRGLTDLFQLPHNIDGLVSSLNKDLYISPEKIQGISRLVGNSALKRDFTGPRLFIRAEYSECLQQDRNGWLDALNILGLNEETRIFSKMDITNYTEEVITHCATFLSEFGKVHNIYALALPKNESIMGIVRASKLADINPLLARCSERIYFPIIHPDWVTEYPQY
ncbi:MAG: hypothetical protein OEZ43_01655 [Gammaproteobacteria bacterium]|nr:hypothetical protein [Gammaproteobacteria bacterium]